MAADELAFADAGRDYASRIKMSCGIRHSRVTDASGLISSRRSESFFINTGLVLILSASPGVPSPALSFPPEARDPWNDKGES